MKLSLQIVAIGSLSLLAGCTRFKPRMYAPQRDHHEFHEAKLLDVSLPVGVTAYELPSPDTVREPSETMVWYETEFSATMLHEFYQIDMERLGWKEVQSFISSPELLLVYETPRKIAAISIREKAQKRSVIICVGQRRS